MATQLTDQAAANAALEGSPEPQPRTVLIRDFEPGDAHAFQAINEAWITRYFQLEPKDRETLSDPTGSILSKGGKILMAEWQGTAVGCCALIPIAADEYEVAKMGVLEEAQGKGVGRLLLERAVAYGRQLGARRLYLETNHQLLPAIRLYRSVGFRDLSADQVKRSPYARADVYMELLLST